MNKKGGVDIGETLKFVFYLFTSVILYFLLLDPIVSPVIELAVGSVDSVGLKIVIKLIPIGVVFGFLLWVVSTIRRGSQ